MMKNIYKQSTGAHIYVLTKKDEENKTRKKEC